MPEYPHDRPHVFLDGRAHGEAYIGRGGGRRHLPPDRNRQQHAQRLQAELTQALAVARQPGDVAVRRAPGETPGHYLEFVLDPLGRQFIQSLENRQQGIELLSVADIRQTGEIRATVFVPSGAENFFRKRIEAYRTEDTAKGRPKNERLVASIDRVALAMVQSLFTDDLDHLPVEDIPIWWKSGCERTNTSHSCMRQRRWESG